MITDETKFVQIKESKGWVTNIDDRDLPEDYFLRVRGLLNATASKIVQRDFGIKHRYGSYPTVNIGSITILDCWAYQDATDNVEYEIVAGLDPNNGLHYFVFDSGSWVEITRIITCQVSSIAVGGPDAVVNTKTETENGSAIAALPTGTYPSGLEAWVAVNTTQVSPSSALIERGNSAHQITLKGVDVTGTGLNWNVNDTITLYRSAGLYTASFNPINGATPHLRAVTQDTQRKVTLLYGGSTSPVSTRIPLIVTRRPQRTYFIPTSNPGGAAPQPAGTPLLKIPDGIINTTAWFTEQGGGLCPFRAIFGTKTALKIGTAVYATDSATFPDTTNYPSNAWIRITVQNLTADGAGPTPATNVYSFLYITVGYDNYEESDPIFKGFFANNYQLGNQTLAITANINPALMPKNATQLRVYRYMTTLERSLTVTEIQAFLGAIGDDQLFLQKTINIQDYTNLQGVGGDIFIPTTPSSDSYGRWASIQYTSVVQQPESVDTIESNLGHAVIDTGALIKPRYAARATRSQGAVVVVDQDDSTLRVSSYDGSGVNEDDNFPDDTTDSTGGALLVFLTSFGELLGISINNDQIVALKRNAIEIADFQADQRQQSIQADVISKRSIVQTPYGLVWAGNSAIYILPADGSAIRILNPQWKNWYDGTLLTSNATPTPFLTQAQRQAIFSGYDPTYNAYWAVMTCQTEDGSTTEQLIARFYFERLDSLAKENPGWDIRQIGGFSATFLSRRKDTLTVGYGSGIEFYPNNVGAGNFKDNVASDNSGGTGIPLKALINLGSLHSLSLQNVFTGVKFDVKALGTGVYVSRYYINDLVVATEVKTHKITEPPHTRELPPWGSIRRMRVEIELVADVGNISQFDINTILIPYIPRPNVGPGIS